MNYYHQGKCIDQGGGGAPQKTTKTGTMTTTEPKQPRCMVCALQHFIDL